MDNKFQTQMFKAGAQARLEEIIAQPGMEKAAAGLMRAGAGVAKNLWSGAKKFPGAAAQKLPTFTHELKPLPVTGASGATRELLAPQMRPWAKSLVDNRGRIGLGAGAAATAYGAKAYGDSERQNMLDNYQRMLNDYQQSAGLNSMWGRTKALLGYLTGGQNYTDKLMGQAAQFGAGQSYLSRGNRNMLAEWASRRGFRPNNTVVSN